MTANYCVTYNNNYYKKIATFEEAIYVIYDNISLYLSNKVNNIQGILLQLKLYNMIYNTTINIFNLKYENNHLILYNANNIICVSDIFPLCSSLDTNISLMIHNKSQILQMPNPETRGFVNAYHNKTKNTKPLKIINQVNTSNMNNHSYLCQDQIINNIKKNVNIELLDGKTQNKKKSLPNKFVENEKIARETILQDKNTRASQTNIRNDTKNDVNSVTKSEKIRIFCMDKEIYQKINKDVSSGKILQNEIPDFFALKYDIFRILDNRKELDFVSNDNVEYEHHSYTKLYNIVEEDVEPPIGDKSDKIYIPHNYEYMSQHEKNVCASKYNMTPQEFEKKASEIILDDNKIYD